jgi:hypothetical protein
MKARLLTLLPVLFLTTVAVRAEEPPDKAQQLAKDVWKASGGENWGKVKELHFTYIVEQDGKELSRAEHDWNVAAGTDRVKWKGKDVTVNVAAPAQDEESKAAHARWVNDSYWLLAPLKILDPGVKISYEGMKDADGAFAIASLTPGPGALTLETKDGAFPVATPITLAPGATVGVRLALKAEGGTPEEKKKKKGGGAGWTGGAIGAMTAVLIGFAAAAVLADDASKEESSVSPSTPADK